MVVSRARAFVDTANAAISEAILGQIAAGYQGPYPETVARSKRAAEAGHAWLSAAPLSLQQSADRVALRLGTPEAPSAWRFTWDAGERSRVL